MISAKLNERDEKVDEIEAQFDKITGAIDILLSQHDVVISEFDREVPTKVLEERAVRNNQTMISKFSPGVHQQLAEQG